MQMEEESSKFMTDRMDRQKHLLERQTREIEAFDLQSASMGLNMEEIVEATQDSYQDDDVDSVRGSVLSLSLTPSNSSGSFFSNSGSAALHPIHSAPSISRPSTHTQL